MAEVSAELIEQEARKVAALFNDGFQASDVFKALTHLMQSAEVVEGATGEEKKKLVIKGFKRVYEIVDPDISSWIPQWVERKAVNWALDSFLPPAIDWAVGFARGRLTLKED